MDPTAEELNRAFEEFIDMYGFDVNNRLLFFFSGHGHTRKDGQKGYLVPADAPNPNRDRVGFLRKALPMNQILAWSRQVEAKHAIFLFDSCFSGTVFKARDLPERPPHISRATALPVRQYITAGDAGETVPAKSVFTPAFVDALEYGWGDLNGDGYVSGTELGLYLQEKVPRHSRQSPQYGKIRDYELARGDFIFQLASSGAAVSAPSPVPARTILSVRANLGGARVLLDGREVGRTPLSDVQVSPGYHRLRVEAKGYEPYRKRIQIERGRSISLYVELSESGPRKGRLFVETEPEDAKVRVLNIGPTFYQGMELDPGRYHLEVFASEYKTKKRWVNVGAGEDESVSIRLEPLRTASAGDLPKLITFTSYKVGSLGYLATSGFRKAIEQLTTMKVRVEPYDTDVARILPLKTNESELSILTGATGTCASYGIAEFSRKEWGPQPIRQVWRGLTLYLSLLARGDSGLRYPADIKGKRLPKVPGWPAGMLSIEGIMAFGNVYWKDVTAVPMSGYVDQLKGIIQGKIDVGYAATVTPTVKELQAGPHKAGWILLPKANKEGWKRLQAIAPWLTPGLCKRAPGLPKGDTMEVGSYPYSIWSYAQVDPDIIYTVVKAMDKGFDIYKGMHRAMPAFNIKGAVRDPSPVPYHEGAIRYFKEVGVWTSELDAWQKKQLKAFEERLAKFKKK